MPFDIHSIYRQLFNIWRQRRFKLFLLKIQPKSTDTLLDVGGNAGFWASRGRFVHQIDVVNIDEPSLAFPEGKRELIRCARGDGCALGMGDKSYDIGFSNSVIEHVGSWERQQKFASEIRRVGKALWVQTPAYECPIEPHYLTPFVHYLPPALRKKIARRFTVWGLLQRPNAQEIKSMVEDTRLLRKAEMQQLFPDCEIHTERMLWVLPKSYVAIRRS